MTNNKCTCAARSDIDCCCEEAEWVGKWMPIETAPIERRVLVFEDPQYGDQSIEVGIFLIRYGEKTCYIGNKSAAVTHWSPLPSCPYGKTK